MIPSTPKQESVREHYPFLTSKARLRALLRQNENITNKDVLQLEIEINTRLPNRISLNIVVK